MAGRLMLLAGVLLMLLIVGVLAGPYAVALLVAIIVAAWLIAAGLWRMAGPS